MSSAHTLVDRRTLLNHRNGRCDRHGLIGLLVVRHRVGAAGLTGGAFDKIVPLATAAPAAIRPRRPATPSVPAPARDSDAGQGGRDAAGLSKERSLTLYRQMGTSRRWETAMKDLFVSGEDNLYGAFHTYVGEEAVAVGVIAALNDDDYIASTHRGHGHLIAKGGDINKMSAEIFFKSTGYNRGYGGSMHITDMSPRHHGHERHRRRQLLHGGRGRPARRCAARRRWAWPSTATAQPPRPTTSAPSERRQPQGAGALRQREQLPYMGVPMALTVPTMTCPSSPRAWTSRITSWTATTCRRCMTPRPKAVAWARAGKGPSVIEAITYAGTTTRLCRWSRGAGRRDGPAIPHRRRGAPVDPARSHRAGTLMRLLARGVTDESALGAIDREIDAAVEASIAFARSSPDPAPEDGVRHTYASGTAPATQFFNRTAIASRLT
ncbi:MAG: thiamine pyrophosphate-dependent enzyme [Vicinamibacterales bacterium]